jgi:hypothetical protein
MWLLQISNMPLAAANTPEQVSSENAEQTPNFVEQENSSGYQAKGKSILPIVLIGVGVVAVAAVLFLVVLKTTYNPVGTWSGTMTNQTTNYTWPTDMIFTGGKKSGTFIYTFESGSGNYTCSGKDINYSCMVNSNILSFMGQFDNKDKMSGTWQNESYADYKGTWQFIRVPTVTEIPMPQNQAGTKGTVKGN